ncbi:nucleotide-binding alpha-beta plait domain-containing protein [Artemisia annua]|uniref:Nucleotide-binding alpha-beta plait domain-containing protein n=1 Tax=Artemisia annua TaxID=35608 RepID=A0A2U1LGG0_ARTAN|nr:nucleotide-binding alpha-beta plait domain-containing protein [Artemisia annua]
MDRRRRNPIPDNVQRRITKFFVTNLPEGCSGTDLATLVRPHGLIFAIYIARKRDKGGNRFGFVSMLDVKDKDNLLKNLRGIRLGDCKLWFNVARFVLEDGEINTGGESLVPNQNEKKMQNKEGASYCRTYNGGSGSGSRSFRDLLTGKSIDMDTHVNAFSTVHDRAVVARMVDVDAVNNIHVILKSVCPGYDKIQYLGGLDVLVTFEDSVSALAFRDVAISMKERFSDIIVWRGQSLSSERVAWIKVQGIPLHLLSNHVIDTIGSTVGKIVHKGNMSESDRDLSYAYVAVLVGDGKRISEEITLNWKNQKYRVSVTEELREWVPDFLNINDVTVSSDSEDDAMAEEEDIGSSDDEESDVVRPEKSNDIIAEKDLNLETVEGALNGIDNPQSLPFKENVSVGEDFIPAADPSTSKIVKRKKCKKAEVGRSSQFYTSSNESLKVSKKAKNVEDLFGLNSLLGLNDNNPPTDDYVNVAAHFYSDDLATRDEPIDLNSQPLQQRVNDEVADTTVDAHAMAVEIEATKSLGDMLGVNLNARDSLIQQSVLQEGLQSGKI